MDLSHTRRSPSRFNISKFTFVFFALAVSIFGWGLQYKLSLYEPHVVTHSMPEAKLLSRDESQRGEGELLAQESPAGNPLENLALAGAVALCALLNLRTPTVVASASLQSPDVQPGLGRPVLASLFFRPPPAVSPL